jgi:hypothetical protein
MTGKTATELLGRTLLLAAAGTLASLVQPPAAQAQSPMSVPAGALVEQPASAGRPTAPDAAGLNALLEESRAAQRRRQAELDSRVEKGKQRSQAPSALEVELRSMLRRTTSTSKVTLREIACGGEACRVEIAGETPPATLLALSDATRCALPLIVPASDGAGSVTAYVDCAK